MVTDILQYSTPSLPYNSQPFGLVPACVFPTPKARIIILLHEFQSVALLLGPGTLAGLLH